MNQVAKTPIAGTTKNKRDFEVLTMATGLEDSQKLKIHINKISSHDLMDAIESAFKDFRQNKTYSMILGAFFALGGLLFLVSLYELKLYIFLNVFLFIFAIVGAFVAAAFYEISWRGERKQEVRTSHLLTAISRIVTRSGSYFVLGFLILSTMVIWMVITGIVYLILFDSQLMPAADFASAAFTTAHGWTFLILNNLLGMIFATLLFGMSAFSFQILYEHNLDIDQAISTSITAVSENPVIMLIWAGIITLAMLISFVAGFVPLIVIMPLLGYSAWHIYRKTISIS